MDDLSDRYLRQLLHQMDVVIDQAQATLTETLKLRRQATSFVTQLQGIYEQHATDIWLEEQQQANEYLASPEAEAE